jgi:hypothetical protein
VVRDDQERRRLRERRVFGEERRIDMAVWADQREVAGLLVQRTGGAPDGRVGVASDGAVADRTSEVAVIEGWSGRSRRQI